MAFKTAQVNPERVIGCFLHYLEREGHKVSRAAFEQNPYEKLDDQWFRSGHGGPIRVQTIGDSSSRRTLAGKKHLITAMSWEYSIHMMGKIRKRKNTK
jgi:hypothetical protein